MTGADVRLTIADLSVQLAKRQGPTTLIDHVSLELAQGEIVGLIGESGSGKTMTCRAVVGALPHRASITSGTIRVAGEKVSGRGASRVAMIFADPHASLDPLQRVGNQIAEVARVHRALRRTEAREEALRLIGQVLLPDPERTASLFPFELSGGMAQRAMIASVLAGKPHFILADEPTSALDATVQLEVIDLVARLAREENVGILLTTHDVALAARVCDRIGVMYAGRIVELGATADVLERPQHPYTKLLMAARPRGRRTHRLTAIPGEPPVPGEPRPPCPFAPRCPWAQEICLTAVPELLVRDGVAAACHFAGALPALEEVGA
jgi:oligopeptide/dipeptide ABC transporter ATP-binding protein